ncbi:nucleotide sugar dehydrogenase [Actinoallomurus iriomotensis]|uniref:UDP-N-acetyl-D-mannosaminuronic acid dehydrogenase n=1 Tax=Actinoallomurus iriomotensis TaxID=478107 RepID=A0A9W6W0P1_9ACTN|nr:nucleotide sugar dehydrogenase [Actinoallomurus iriomotensis]GLY85116.1 UDP-N-acetyl-D-mannosaminuronic acid dehydrogenase [Actinoallomurus iriomotensis]
MRFLPEGTSLSVAVVGFGYVGSCLGATLAGGDITVLGVDSDRGMVEEMNAGRCRFGEPGLAGLLAGARESGALQVTADYELIAKTDVIVVTVGTPIDDAGSALTGQLEAACRELAPRLRPGQLVILKSTVPPGTMRGLVLPLLEAGGLRQGTDFGLAFCPERLAEGAALDQLRRLPIVVGGVDPDSTSAAAAFWQRALGVRTIGFDAPEVAEFVKLADNWWIDLNIAMANELAKVCAAYDTDVLDVITAANSLPKGDSFVNILRPSIGVGGSCLTKDPWMVWHAARDHGVALRTVETARAVNDGMPGYAFDVVTRGLAALGRPGPARVAVLGVSFKSDTGDMRRTPVKPVIGALRAAGHDVTVYDPLVPRSDAEAVLGVPAARTPREAAEGAACVAVLAGHREFQELDFGDLRSVVEMPCLILDGRAYYSREKIDELGRLGFVYRGIGR